MAQHAPSDIDNVDLVEIERQSLAMCRCSRGVPIYIFQIFIKEMIGLGPASLVINVP